MATIGVIDYGMGNLHSIAKALERVSHDYRIEVSFDPDKLRRCDKLVLPGVGGVRHCMDELERLELTDMVREIAGEIPMLGICLGMQAMLDYSEENCGVDGLGLFSGRVVHFPLPAEADSGSERLKVPHMGWNRVRPRINHPLWDGIDDGAWFYFVHSYHAKCMNEEDIFGETDYGRRFTCALLRENIFAVQFHPEKSQMNGMTLLSNFVQWDGSV